MMSAPTSQLEALTQHIAQIITHLVEQQSVDSDNASNKTAAGFELLLISNTDHTKSVAKALETGFKDKLDLAITTHSPQDFVQINFNKRYDLGCFIEGSLIDNQPLQPLTPLDTDTLKLIATRLRDLFAEQSLLFLAVSGHCSGPDKSDGVTDKFSLNDLGYTLLPITESDDCYSHCWQFNLYDYKRQPDWLNARFWANPENFDKYRW